jgi:hypothetical protein
MSILVYLTRMARTHDASSALGGSLRSAWYNSDLSIASPGGEETGGQNITFRMYKKKQQSEEEQRKVSDKMNQSKQPERLYEGAAPLIGVFASLLTGRPQETAWQRTLASIMKNSGG